MSKQFTVRIAISPEQHILKGILKDRNLWTKIFQALYLGFSAQSLLKKKKKKKKKAIDISGRRRDCPAALLWHT